MSEETSESGSIVAWFLTGAIIGTVLGILYAPRSGKETRRAVAESSKDALDAGRDMFDRGRKIVEDAADLFERGRRLVQG